MESSLDFEFETENQVYYSCIATLFGNFYVLGGSSQNGRQVVVKKIDMFNSIFYHLKNGYYLTDILYVVITYMCMTFCNSDEPSQRL